MVIWKLQCSPRVIQMNLWVTVGTIYLSELLRSDFSGRACKKPPAPSWTVCDETGQWAETKVDNEEQATSFELARQSHRWPEPNWSKQARITGTLMIISLLFCRVFPWRSCAISESLLCVKVSWMGGNFPFWGHCLRNLPQALMIWDHFWGVSATCSFK